MAAVTTCSDFGAQKNKVWHVSSFPIYSYEREGRPILSFYEKKGDYGLRSDQVQLWELDSKEGRTPKNWCLQTVVLEKTLESPLDSKEIKLVNLKGNRHWILVGRTDAEAEVPVFWSSDTNSWLIGKVPDAGKDWGHKEKRASEDEMAGWHHRCNGQELGKTLGDCEGQGGLACCSHGVTKSWTQLGDWTTMEICVKSWNVTCLWLKIQAGNVISRAGKFHFVTSIIERFGIFFL